MTRTTKLNPRPSRVPDRAQPAGRRASISAPDPIAYAAAAKALG